MDRCQSSHHLPPVEGRHSHRRASTKNVANSAQHRRVPTHLPVLPGSLWRDRPNWPAWTVSPLSGAAREGRACVGSGRCRQLASCRRGSQRTIRDPRGPPSERQRLAGIEVTARHQFADLGPAEPKAFDDLGNLHWPRLHTQPPRDVAVELRRGTRSRNSATAPSSSCHGFELELTGRRDWTFTSWPQTPPLRWWHNCV